MTAKLRESASLAAKGAKRRIRLISEGPGSSGLYEAAVLQRDGAIAFPQGTHIYLDHLTEDEDDARGGSHSIKDLVGVTLNDASFSEGALIADANFFSNFAPLLEEMREYIDLSIEASGSVKEGVVESLHPSPLNAISIVPRGGRDGKILELIESYRESGNISGVENLLESTQEHRKDKGMTPEDIEKVAEAVAKAIASQFDDLKEALKPATAPEPNQETEAPTAADVAEALVVANLPRAARDRVYEALKVDGAVLADVIEAEKNYITEIKESVASTDDDTFVRESTDKKFDRRVGSW
jgi:hypothetical protein